MTTVTNETKIDATVTNEAKGPTDRTWADLTYTWAEATHTWELQSLVLDLESKNSTSVTNETKN